MTKTFKLFAKMTNGAWHIFLNETI